MNYEFSKSENNNKIKLKISFAGKNCEVLKSGKCTMLFLAYKSSYDPSGYNPESIEKAVISGAIETEIHTFSKEQMLEMYRAKSSEQEFARLYESIKDLADGEMGAFVSLWYKPDAQISITCDIKNESQAPNYSFLGSSMPLPRSSLSGDEVDIVFDWSAFVKLGMTPLNSFYDIVVSKDGLQKLGAPGYRTSLLYNTYYFIRTNCQDDAAPIS